MKRNLQVPLLVAALMAAALSAFAAEPATARSTSTVLRLANGDYASGTLADTADADVVRFNSELFAAPLAFPAAALEGVFFPLPEKLPQPEGDYWLELANGDLLAGSLVGLDSEHLVIDLPSCGPLGINRAALHRLSRRSERDTSELIYFGPNGIAEWRNSGKSPAWREKAGRLAADERGAAISRDFGLPDLACIEIDLSWSTKPDFLLALAVPPRKEALRSFAIEVWDGDLVALVASEREADMTAMQKLPDGPGRIALVVYLDQKQGRMLVFSSAGQRLAFVSASCPTPQTLGGIQIVNKQGDLKIESLRVNRWNGESPNERVGDKPRFTAASGEVTEGTIKSFDAGQFVVETAAGESRMDQAAINDIFFAHKRSSTPESLRAVHLCGMRLSGNLLKVADNKLWLACPGIKKPVGWPIDRLQALVTLESQPGEPPPAGRRGRLEFAGGQLRGALVDAMANDTGCLVWQSDLASAPAQLTHGASATIVYRDPPVVPKSQPMRGVPAVRNFAVAPSALQRLRAQAGGGPGRSAVASSTQVLHLRCGDTIPCTVSHVDEHGITLATSVSDVTFVRHDLVKALELAPDVAPATIAKSKRDRLLTLPRMQRDNPPTQLVRSLKGDYLRGRLVEMDEKNLQLEIRLETKTLPRENVARVIWLHPDEIEQEASASKPAETAGQTRVQAVPGSGNRLTFVAQDLAGKTLSGQSEVLGACHVDLETVDRVLVGGEIDRAAAELAFHPWRLSAARDPLEAQASGPEGEDGEGLLSDMVGKAAPKLELPLADGKTFRLADQKDKIVVLDFWASWCGPCLQSLPQVDKVARELADQNVMLVAVNLEETAEKVSAAVERLGIKSLVVLDRDGRAAEKYGVTAIPQTVIIDRQGNVARVFTGGGARFEAQLRAALQSVIQPASTSAEPRE